MPELPEVETVCRGLAKVLIGAEMVTVDVRRPDLRMLPPVPKNLAARLKGGGVLQRSTAARNILWIELDGGDTLLLHLGMSGRVVITHKAKKPGKHDHLIFKFNNGVYVLFQ